VDVYPTRDAHGHLVILLTNHARPRHPIKIERVEVRLTHVRAPVAGALVRRIDRHHANPRDAWTAMGKPDYLSLEQVRVLEAASACAPEPLDLHREGNSARFVLDLPAHGVASVSIALQPASA
jgi:hypothetical protein